jgi:minor curlin subunit
MRTYSAGLAIAAAALALGAQAGHAQGSFANPCSASNGGSCTAGSPQLSEVSKPEPLRSSAYIAQVGDGNAATINQNSTRQVARIVQNGDASSASATQTGDGTAYLEIDQAGLMNSVVVRQSADLGAGNIAVVAQQGEGNAILLDQSGIAGSVNTAMLAQQGSGNQMQLGQDGADNRAELVQFGDNNAMTATQNGSANQLRWVQNGSGLSDLQIVQSGGQAMSITQSNGGS